MWRWESDTRIYSRSKKLSNIRMELNSTCTQVEDCSSINLVFVNDSWEAYAVKIDEIFGTSTKFIQLLHEDRGLEFPRRKKFQERSICHRQISPSAWPARIETEKPVGPSRYYRLEFVDLEQQGALIFGWNTIRCSLSLGLSKNRRKLLDSRK